MKKYRTLLSFFAIQWLTQINYAFAGSLEGSLQSLVNGLVGRILPILSLAFLALHVFRAYIQDNPEIARRTPAIIAGCLSILSISSVWSWIQTHVR